MIETTYAKVLAGKRREFDRGGHHARVLAVGGVLGGDERAAGHRVGADVVERPVAVVAAAEHLQQGRRVGAVAVDPLPEDPHQWFGAGHHRGDPLGAVRGIGVLVEVAQVLAHVRVDLSPLASQEGLGEPAEGHATGEVADGGEAKLGGGDQVFQCQARCLVQRLAAEIESLRARMRKARRDIAEAEERVHRQYRRDLVPVSKAVVRVRRG